MHAQSNFDARTLMSEELLSHAMFLYKASWQPPDDAELWFATSTAETRCKGSELYMPSHFKPNTAAGKVIKRLKAKFPFIHDIYLTALPRDTKWPNWLCRSFKISLIPRIATKPSSSSPD